MFIYNIYIIYIYMYICICIIYIYFQLHEKSDILVIYAFRFCLLFCDERS